ncbi:hypothetical protein DXV65_15905 [Pseudomonas fluorescens]|nr:hypothetical protein DXV65_15905 [Pseudomonas fluorescens]QTV20406.1 hypothetical protein J9321_28070 [Pseudomonas fluorescens]
MTVDGGWGGKIYTFCFFREMKEMFHRYVRPVGYGLAIVGTFSLLFSAFELFAGRDTLFAVAKSAVFVALGIWVIKNSVKA